MRKYQFNKALIGDVAEGRPNLGVNIGVEMYRLMQFSLRDVIEETVGADKADEIFYKAGFLAGKFFYEEHINPVNSIDEFISKTQTQLKEKGIGILRIEKTDLDSGKILLTIDEDLDCSGLPEMDYETCIYDEGFVAALFESFTNKEWVAKEIDCWCTGARTCRFAVDQK